MLTLAKGAIYQVTEANKAGTDWYDELTHTAPLQRHTLGFRVVGSTPFLYWFVRCKIKMVSFDQIDL